MLYFAQPKKERKIADLSLTPPLAPSPLDLHIQNSLDTYFSLSGITGPLTFLIRVSLLEVHADHGTISEISILILSTSRSSHVSSQAPHLTFPKEGETGTVS